MNPGKVTDNNGMMRAKLFFLLLYAFFISCELSETGASDEIAQKPKIAVEKREVSITKMDEIITNPGEKYHFVLGLAKNFKLSSVISFNEQSLKIHEYENGLLAGHFEYSDTLGNWATLFITDKAGHIKKSQKFPRFFRKMEEMIIDKSGNFYLRGAPAVSSESDEIIQKYNANLQLQWQKSIEQIEDSGVSMFIKNKALYFFTHQGDQRKKFVVLKYNPLNGALIQRFEHPTFVRPIDKTYSAIVESSKSSVQLDDNTFHYIYQDQANDTTLYSVYIRYSFELERFLMDQDLRLAERPTGKLITCHDKDGGFFSFHSHLHRLSRYNAFGDLSYHQDIRDDFLPYIPGEHLSMRCQNDEIEIFGMAKMNKFNNANIMLSSKFSKKDGSFISSHFLKMYNHSRSEFFISNDVNGKYHFYYPEHIVSEMDYRLHISGVNF